MCPYVFCKELSVLLIDNIVPQAQLESDGLPPCEGVVNLSGENLMNPMRW